MTDVLIRDVPEEVVRALDARADRLGISRNEYVRRRLAQDAVSETSPVEVADLKRLSEILADLHDEDVMDAAWR
jgi:plasmid stability protein